jgi:hypothetical protein
MTKYLSLAALALLISTAATDAQISFPCQAFQMQPNGMLAVVQSVTITNGGASVQLNPGTSFGPGTVMAGINVYATFQQNCR